MEDNVVRRGRGRPKKDDSFDRVLRFCANEEHEYMKNALEEELDMSGGEVLRYCLEMVYNMKIGWKN